MQNKSVFIIPETLPYVQYGHCCEGHKPLDRVLQEQMSMWVENV